MDKRNLNNPIRRSLDARLSGITEKPGSAARVLRLARGEEKVKKKLTVGLALVLVIVLIAVVALAAVVITAAQEKAIRYAMNEEVASNAHFDEWEMQKRVHLLNLLIDADFDLPADLVAAYQAETDIVKKNELANEMLRIKYDGHDGFGQYAIMQEIFQGSKIEWSYQDKAWYYNLLVEYGIATDQYEHYALPEANDMTYEDALIMAKNTVIEKYRESEENINHMGINEAFRDYPGDTGELRWLFEFYNTETSTVMYSVLLTRDGALVDSSHSVLELNNAAMMAADGIRTATPGQHDATEEQALASAYNALTEIIGLTIEKADELEATAEFIMSPEYGMGREPVWLVSYHDDLTQAILYKVLLGYEGSYIASITPDGTNYFTRTHRDGMSLGHNGYNEQGTFFYGWSLEEKAAFYQEWEPRVREYMQTNPYYTGEGDPAYEFTRCAWGLPSDTDITQEQALEIAINAAIKMGVAETRVRTDSECFFYFDATDPHKPLWYISLNLHYSKEDTSGLHGIFVNIDAKTGEMINAVDSSKLVPWELLIHVASD